MAERHYPRYRLITGPDDDSFCQRVSEAISLGYRLYGDPAIATEAGHARVAQALVWDRETLPPLRSVPKTAGVALDHCVIHVSDWTASNHFYAEVIGAELVDRGDGTWFYRFGGQQLNVHGPGPSRGPLARIPVSPGSSDLCFVWDGPIEEAVAHLNNCGVQVESGPEERSGARGAGTSVYFRDPDGSLMEFISYDGGS